MRHSQKLFHRCLCTCCDDGGSFRAPATSRRSFLAGAALTAAGAAAPLLSVPVRAQGGDPELNRLQSQRRIVLKGGVVLTLDRQVGDFAASGPADRGWQDSRDPAEYRGLHRCRRGRRRHEPHHHSGLRRHPQPFLSGPRPQHPGERAAQSRLQPRHPDHADAGLFGRRRLCRRTPLRARLHRDGHDRHRRHLAMQPHARALRCHDPRAIEAGIRAVYSYHRGAGDKHQYPQDIKRLQKTYFSSKDQLLTLALTDQSQREHLFARARGRRAGRAASRRQGPQQAGAGACQA